MTDLSDNEFDRLLKQKAEAFDHDFDESAWLKMEKKLKRRDRVIIFRNTSIIMLLLMLGGTTFFTLNTTSNGDNINSDKTLAVKRSGLKLQAEETPTLAVERNVDNPENEGIPVQRFEPAQSSKNDFTKDIRRVSDIPALEAVIPPADNADVLTLSALSTRDRQLASDTSTYEQPVAATKAVINVSEAIITSQAISESDTGKFIEKKRRSRNLGFSITVLAGPEFSSVQSQQGKGSINAGLLLNAALSSKITVSTGLRYGVKNYLATSSEYQLQYPSRANLITGIDASCNILEIPLQVSYALVNDDRKRIQVSSGLSSYLMLKEEYNFKYTPGSGFKDFLLVRENANQHYLSVLNLSASYQFKPKAVPQLQWAIEPFVKLPMGGVGEGNVHLKSVGMSLNLTYDFAKKHK